MNFAVCALIEKEGKILAVTRRNKPDDWGLPGGKVEPGEDAETAIIREVLEETGLKVVGLSKIFEDIATEEGQEWSTITFHCQTEGLPYSAEKGIDVAYISFEKLCSAKNTFHEYNRKLYNELADSFYELMMKTQQEDWDFDATSYLAGFEEDLHIFGDEN